MTIPKAIEMISSLLGETPEQLATPMQQALKLGIEALKVLIMFRSSPWTSRFYKLPGETEE